MGSDSGELSWSDSHSTASDDNSSVHFPQSPLWANPTATTRLDTGQLSPISTELEMPLADTMGGIPNMIHSATSSSNDSWSTSYSEEADGDDAEHDMHWEQGSDDVLTVPKLEPVEDEDFHMDELKEAPRTPQPECHDHDHDHTQAPKTKRPRGRPRKHPLTAHISANKVAKGRSKTGCITCRKRKKKCDEAKPRCKTELMC